MRFDRCRTSRRLSLRHELVKHSLDRYSTLPLQWVDNVSGVCK